MYFCLLWPLSVLNNTCLAVGSMVVPLPTPTQRQTWSREKRRFLFRLRHQREGRCSARPGPSSRSCSDGLQMGLQSECSWPLRPCPELTPLPGEHQGASSGRSSTRGRPCPVPRAVTICRGGARPQRTAVVPGWSRGPPALLVERGHAPGGHRAGCVASTPAWEHPCLNLNTFILTANKQRIVFLRLSQSCRLSPLGSRGLAALPFLPSCWGRASISFLLS